MDRKEQVDVLSRVLDNAKIERNPFTDYVKQIPYNIHRSKLYSIQELFDVFDKERDESLNNCLDTVVYRHVVKTGTTTNLPFEIVTRDFHDLGMRLAMESFLEQYEQRQVVGVMGGHALSRQSTSYRQAAMVCKRLTEQGFLMISGGGPGAMEATHLGAWMAGRSDQELQDALEILAKAPCFEDRGWMARAFEVIEKYPRTNEKYKSLSIPTWFYGHEPPSAFATHIAKLFDNSVREDTLLTVAYGGILYFKGSAGTLQEIFQEAVQNHYVSLGYPSPMIFVDKKYWTEEVPVVPFIQHMLDAGRYKNLLISVVDTTEEILQAVTQWPDASNT